MKKEIKKQFLKELRELLERYKVSISHEDSHGAFRLENWNKENWGWLKDGIEWGDSSQSD